MPRDTLAELSDDALLVLYANGDPEAVRLLAARLAPRLMAYGMRLLGDRAEAEDVAQEAMLRLWKQAPDWRQGEAQVSTWLFRVASNLATDRLRQRKRRKAEPLKHGDEEGIDPPDTSPGAMAQLMQADRMAALQLALDSLPDRQRQAVVLRHIEGFTNPEIAEVMGIGVEAVESLTARGKRALTAALEGRREELGYGDDD